MEVFGVDEEGPPLYHCLQEYVPTPTPQVQEQEEQIVPPQAQAIHDPL